MIDATPYKTRSPKFLHKELVRILNKLRMRDWQVKLVITKGDFPNEVPAKFNEEYCPACCTFHKHHLHATIWISIANCKLNDVDPLFGLYHEVFHIFKEYDRGDELFCNILADLVRNPGDANAKRK